MNLSKQLFAYYSFHNFERWIVHSISSSQTHRNQPHHPSSVELQSPSCLVSSVTPEQPSPVTMADLDAELLALAGGDSSGDEGSMSATPPPTNKRSPPRRRSRSSSSRRESLPPEDMGRKGIAQKVKKGATRKPAVRRKRSYSEDEDEEYVVAFKSFFISLTNVADLRPPPPNRCLCRSLKAPKVL